MTLTHSFGKRTPKILEPLPQAEQQDSRRQSPSRKPKHMSRCHGPATGFTTTAWSTVINGSRRHLVPRSHSRQRRPKTARAKTVDEDQRICAPLEVLAKTSTRGLEHGRLVEFVTSDGSTKRHIVPMRLFAGRGEEALGELLSLGLETGPPPPKPGTLIHSGSDASGSLCHGALHWLAKR